MFIIIVEVAWVWREFIHLKTWMCLKKESVSLLGPVGFATGADDYDVREEPPLTMGTRLASSLNL